jgi:hypothetical protein
VQAGYTVGYKKLTNIFNANWNRNNAQTTNLLYERRGYRRTSIMGHSRTRRPVPLNTSPLNYGVPDITLTDLTGLNEQQPNFSLSQTISFSEVLSWIHGKHNLRFGGDYRRVHRDFLGGSNATRQLYIHWIVYGGAEHYDNGSRGNRFVARGFPAGIAAGDYIDSSSFEELPARQRMGCFAMDDWRCCRN